MASPSAAEAALKLEIARLTGAINQAKSDPNPKASSYRQSNSGHNAYNPVYSRSNKYINPSYKLVKPAPVPPTKPTPPANKTVPLSTSKKDVVIGGVAFQSSGRSLVRKDLVKAEQSIPTKPASAKPPPRATTQGRVVYGQKFSAHRPYKPKSSRGRPTRPVNRNMTLNNKHRPYQSRKLAHKRLKYSDKPCPRFNMTGTCSRGLTCPYQHNPDKIAICWKFLQGNCPNTPETCNLSHVPTPERTPLCVHFANNGRCNRANCPYPHVRVGPRQGVCRDFAVLGYCEKGLDCEHEHVRECPDFAERGNCTTRGCKLPHVIRASRTRKTTAAVTPGETQSARAAAIHSNDPVVHATPDPVGPPTNPPQRYFAEDATLGDEFISLTFHESEDEESEDEGSDSDNDDDSNNEGEEGDSNDDDMEQGYLEERPDHNLASNVESM